jgi:O-antigen/teichoic acid export membrane protein
MNLVLSLILVHFLGKEGVALGTLLPVLVFEPYYLFKVCKILKTTVWGYTQKVILPLLVPALIIIVAIEGCRLAHPPDSLAQVLLIAVVSMTLYLLSFFSFSMTNAERQLVQQRIGFRSSAGI